MNFDDPIINHADVCILVIDLVDSVRHMQTAENWCIDVYRRFTSKYIAEDVKALRGRVVKSLGDGLMLEFAHATDAVNAAFAAHRGIARAQVGRNTDGSQPELKLRAGGHRAEVVVEAVDIYGSGVNLAARLASVGGAGEVVVSLELRKDLLSGVDAKIEDMGSCYLRGFEEPVRCFRVVEPSPRALEVAVVPVRPNESLHPTLAILYFEPRFASTEQLIISDLLAEGLIGSVSRSTRLKVISRLSTKNLQGRNLALTEIARLLNADFVASGSFRPEGQRVHFTVELIRVRDQTVVMADSFLTNIGELLEKDPAYAQAVSSKVLGSIISAEAQSALHTPMPTLPSCTLLTAAISSMHNSFDRRWFSKSAEMLEHLVERHPRHPEPYAWLAKWSVLRVVQGISDSVAKDSELAYRAGATALQISPASPLALTMLGLVHAYLRHDFEEAEKAYDLALLSNPNESLAMLLKGTMHAFRAEGPAAVGLVEAAMVLSPLDPLRYFYESLGASAAISNGNYHRAIELANSSIRLNRSHASTWRALAIAQSLSGDHGGAKESVKQLKKLEPDFSVRAFKERFPGRDVVPDYMELLGQALMNAGLPA